MTEYLGTSRVLAQNGMPQKDNGVALVTDQGEVRVAISEERLSRRKHDHSNRQSLQLAERMLASSAPVERIESSCTDLWAADSRTPSHHESHAFLAFATAPFEEALGIVVDAGGNTLSGDAAGLRWWTHAREQTSIWRLSRNGMPELCDYRHVRPFDIGTGEWYRAVTHFLGWPSHTLSGNTMALSSYGRHMDPPGPLLWDDPSGTFDGQILNSPHEPILMTQRLCRLLRLPDKPRLPHESVMEERFVVLAWYLQASLENYLISLVREYGHGPEGVNLCLGGGVAMNCVAVGRLQEVFGRPVHLSCAPSDAGQPLGNAVWGASMANKGLLKISNSPFLGPARLISSEIGESVPGATFAPGHDLVPEMIADGAIVALCHGRSEFGPRALGNRSVLCDPAAKKTVARVKLGVKAREEFMPLAPALLASRARELGVAASVCMSVAQGVPQRAEAALGETVHVDGTARAQAVSSAGLMGCILAAFERSTGRAAVVNTSFNQRGQPIVESGRDAISAFNSLDVDALAVEDGVWVKSARTQGPMSGSAASPA